MRDTVGLIIGYFIRGREGLATFRCAPLRPCGLRFAEGMIFRHGRNRQSNPVSLRSRGSRSTLKRHHPSPEIRGWGDGGQRGIRTLGNITATHAFQACSFDHSDICPWSAGR